MHDIIKLEDKKKLTFAGEFTDTLLFHRKNFSSPWQIKSQVVLLCSGRPGFPNHGTSKIKVTSLPSLNSIMSLTHYVPLCPLIIRPLSRFHESLCCSISVLSFLAVHQDDNWFDLFQYKFDYFTNKFINMHFFSFIFFSRYLATNQIGNFVRYGPFQYTPWNLRWIMEGRDINRI